MPPAPALLVAAVAALAGLVALPAAVVPDRTAAPALSVAGVPRPAGLLAPRAVAPAVTPEVAVRSTAPGLGFRWPLAPVPEVLRRFAVGPHPWSPGHRGVDLTAAVGRPVLSAGPGVVAFAGPVAGRGVVSVHHPGGLRTTYEPVTARVHRGDAVPAGGVLGTLTAGTHCPRACLHWGALRAEVYVDPLSLLLPPVPPVLLPLAGGGAVGRGSADR